MINSFISFTTTSEISIFGELCLLLLRFHCNAAELLSLDLNAFFNEVMSDSSENGASLFRVQNIFISKCKWFKVGLSLKFYLRIKKGVHIPISSLLRNLKMTNFWNTTASLVFLIASNDFKAMLYLYPFIKHIRAQPYMLEKRGTFSACFLFVSEYVNLTAVEETWFSWFYKCNVPQIRLEYKPNFWSLF